MKNYPQHYEQIKILMGKLGKSIPASMQAFSDLHQATTQEAAISIKNKELIALGIAIAVRCDGCIAFHVHDALRANANPAEILETIGVAILMGGGPAVMYGCEALAAMEQFVEEEEKVYAGEGKY